MSIIISNLMLFWFAVSVYCLLSLSITEKKTNALSKTRISEKWLSNVIIPILAIMIPLAVFIIDIVKEDYSQLYLKMIILFVMLSYSRTISLLITTNQDIKNTEKKWRTIVYLLLLFMYILNNLNVGINVLQISTESLLTFVIIDNLYILNQEYLHENLKKIYLHLYKDKKRTFDIVTGIKMIIPAIYFLVSVYL